MLRGLLHRNKSFRELLKGNLRSNVTNEFGNLDVEASTLALLILHEILVLILTLNQVSKKQFDMVVKNCNFQIGNTYASGNI